MIIARSEYRWRVLAFGRVVHESLEHLALDEGYRVAGVCDQLGMSQGYFREIFFRDVGVPPKEWMAWERMVVARRLLCWERPCKEIADRLGFADCNSFRREFKRVYGVPPAVFYEARFGGGRGRGRFAGVPSAECRMPSAECRVPSAECRMPSAECRVPSAECRVRSEK